MRPGGAALPPRPGERAAVTTIASSGTSSGIVAPPARAALVGSDHLHRQRDDGVALTGAVVVEHRLRLAGGRVPFADRTARLAVLRLPAAPVVGWLDLPDLDGLHAWLLVRSVPAIAAAELADAMVGAGAASVRVGRLVRNRLDVELVREGACEVAS